MQRESAIARLKGENIMECLRIVAGIACLALSLMMLLLARIASQSDRDKPDQK